MIVTLWRWEQDGAGGMNGTATYFPNTPNEITVPLPDFTTADALYKSIAHAMKQTRWDARSGLLAEIARIQP